MSSGLSVTDLTHYYPGSHPPAIEDVSFDLDTGEILALIGPSGGGKSTLLRVIAGLEIPRRGRVVLNDRELTGRSSGNVPPERRKVGMVSQGGDLFPHFNVLKNVSYGLRNLPSSARKKRALEALDHVGLAALAKRFPSELSGGEAQRVALARALAPRPSVLLLDEPFSSLDSSLRDRLRRLTSDLLRQTGVTAVFVTHHGEDALSVGDRVGVVESGRLVQLATPREVWNSPVSASVASLLGPINHLPATAGSESSLFRPDQLALGPTGPDCLACGEIEHSEFRGTHRQVSVRIPERESPILVRTSADSQFCLGERVGIRRR